MTQLTIVSGSLMSGNSCLITMKSEGKKAIKASEHMQIDRGLKWIFYSPSHLHTHHEHFTRHLNLSLFLRFMEWCKLGECILLLLFFRLIFPAHVLQIIKANYYYWLPNHKCKYKIDECERKPKKRKPKIEAITYTRLLIFMIKMSERVFIWM